MLKYISITNYTKDKLRRCSTTKTEGWISLRYSPREPLMHNTNTSLSDKEFYYGEGYGENNR